MGPDELGERIVFSHQRYKESVPRPTSVSGSCMMTERTVMV